MHTKGKIIIFIIIIISSQFQCFADTHLCEVLEFKKQIIHNYSNPMLQEFNGNIYRADINDDEMFYLVNIMSDDTISVDISDTDLGQLVGYCINKDYLIIQDKGKILHKFVFSNGQYKFEDEIEVDHYYNHGGIYMFDDIMVLFELQHHKIDETDRRMFQLPIVYYDLNNNEILYKGNIDTPLGEFMRFIEPQKHIDITENYILVADYTSYNIRMYRHSLKSLKANHDPKIEYTHTISKEWVKTINNYESSIANFNFETKNPKKFFPLMMKIYNDITVPLMFRVEFLGKNKILCCYKTYSELKKSETTSKQLRYDLWERQGDKWISKYSSMVGKSKSNIFTYDKLSIYFTYSVLDAYIVFDSYIPFRVSPGVGKEEIENKYYELLEDNKLKNKRSWMIYEKD